MRKRLEAELVSLAHRILQLKNKSEVEPLYQEARKLYETLAALRFYDAHFAQQSVEISAEEWENEVIAQHAAAPVVEVPTAILAEENDQAVLTPEAAEEPAVAPEAVVSKVEEAIEEPATEMVEEVFAAAEEEPVVLSFEPAVSHAETADEPVEMPIQEVAETKASPYSSLQEILGGSFEEPVFVRSEAPVVPVVEEAVAPLNMQEEIAESIAEPTPEVPVAEAIPTEVFSPIEVPAAVSPVFDPLSVSSEPAKTSITMGLNDRIGFVKYLFAESNEDFNRVLSQLNSFHTWQEATDFIEQIVKPDYNLWKGMDDYEARFMEVIEKKFR